MGGYLMPKMQSNVRDTTKRSYTKLRDLVKFGRTFFYDNFTSDGKKKNRERNRVREFYSQFMCPGDLVFDVGANFGSRTRVFLDLKARVIAIEPQEKCIQVLNKQFNEQKDFTLIPKALSSEVGEQEMWIASAPVLSSMSSSWMEKTRESGRFENELWDQKVLVSVTTLDTLIQDYGVPRFCKIDVEGYELEVLRGLSTPICALSFEFVAECADSAVGCVLYLSQLDHYEYNISFGETLMFQFERWQSCDDIVRHLLHLSDKLAWGDVYARIHMSR